MDVEGKPTGFILACTRQSLETGDAKIINTIPNFKKLKVQRKTF
jgi:hypothetical protein